MCAWCSAPRQLNTLMNAALYICFVIVSIIALLWKICFLNVCAPFFFKLLVCISMSTYILKDSWTLKIWQAVCELVICLTQCYLLFNLCLNTEIPPSPTLLYRTQEVTKLTLLVFPCQLFFIKKQNNGYCLRSRGWTVAESRAEGLRTELLFILWRAQDGAWHWTQTRQAARGHERPPHIPKCVCVCVCPYMLVYGHVCFCRVGAPWCPPTN